MAALSASDIFCGNIRELPEVLADPHLHKRGSLQEIVHPELGALTIFTSPLRFNGEPNNPHAYAPKLGQDNETFYADEFGLTMDEIASMRDHRVI